ncbi:phage terminase small subunit-related protein [Fusobacterium varium]|uniref:phage terminase small subunit-related protein n=1 Tax=Fusobacterium varium TaxID=856 RepID=UPI00291E9B49|nr:DNA binding protein [uncultured phage]
MKDHELAKIDYIAGIPIKEIAVKYNVTEAAVRKWKSRHKWDVTKEVSQKVSQCDNVTTNKRSKIDWLKLETEYVTDISEKPVTLKDLSKKYGVSHLVIQQYSSDKKWSELRKEHFKKVSEKIKEKLSDETSDVMADILNNINTALLQATEELNIYEEVNGFGKLVKHETETVRANKLGTIVKALTSLQKIEIEKQRLEIERKKSGNGENGKDKTGKFLDMLEEII